MSVEFKIADLFRENLAVDKTHFILHICNDAGSWGSGFTGVLSRIYPEPEKEYRRNFVQKRNHTKLGAIQVIPVARKDTVKVNVVNMIAQAGVGPSRTGRGEDVPPLRYHALDKCLKLFRTHIYTETKLSIPEVNVIMPAIGSGLAGGDWPTIETLIRGNLWDLPVTIFVLEDEKGRIFQGDKVSESVKVSSPS